MGYMDTLASRQTSIHMLDPRAKLLTTLVFIITVVSFGKYDISPLIPFFIYPVVLCTMGNVPPGYLLKKLALVSPFAIFIGIRFFVFFNKNTASISTMFWIFFVNFLFNFVI